METKSVKSFDVCEYTFVGPSIIKTFGKTLTDFMLMCKEGGMIDSMGPEEWVFTNVFYSEMLRLHDIISKYNTNHISNWVAQEFVKINKTFTEEDVQNMTQKNRKHALSVIYTIGFYTDAFVMAYYRSGGIDAKEADKLPADEVNERFIQTRRQITDALFRAGIRCLRKMHEYFKDAKVLAGEAAKSWDDSLLSSFVTGTEEAEKIWSAILSLTSEQLEKFHDTMYLPKTEKERKEALANALRPTKYTMEQLDGIHKTTWDYLKTLKKIQ